ncbi:pseudaminic acid synthase [Gracilibacillus caseinilyticus]|uniref:Pseudaminic acid synthase n=1 Tax=Gracilibacillus caseinilyticus TaxID=2932256 RepID=A0ABY4F1J5_9BACI|nr:pseudaminic acid synthase [Gracilibacillus caseinilyticus]UOQ48296.1 pseudaminic acid synthase [Gracilibacillus caseinilyticus]
MLIGDIDIDKQVFIIAELSANHGHDIQVAKDTIKAAKEVGADAIKLQTYTPDTITIDCDNEYFQIQNGTIWDGRSLYDLYKEAYTPWEWHEELMEYAKQLGLICFSSPFDLSAVDFLEDLNVPAYKIASFEIIDIPLIEYVASKNKPVIISTGIATFSEIDEAVTACKRAGNDNVILLKCTSSYPAKIEEANLLTMKNFKKTFNVEIGLSDHTLDDIVPITAVALGARVIEKHFILSKEIGGPDASFSLDKNQFRKMVSNVRDAEKSLGNVNYKLTKSKKKSREFSRSLFVTKDIKKGEDFTSNNIRSIRPGYGLKPKYLKDVLGKKASENIYKGTPLKWKYIE